jgi:hypothetical protein
MSPLLVAEKVLRNDAPAAEITPPLGPDATAEAIAEATAEAMTEASLPVTPPVLPGAPEAAPAADAGAVVGVVAAATTADYSATMPVGLAIPAVGLQAQVTPMGWEPIMAGDQVTTGWIVPEQTLGWAVNSAGAGEPGNVVIAGHQAIGAGLLRPLALGEVTAGQEIQLEAADGTVYLYRVSEVSNPITAIGATAEEQAQAAAYLAPTAAPRLTLVSGWPADATTHRLFVVAEFVGAADRAQP